MEFSGRLSAFSPEHLLQWAANDRRTGALVVRSGPRRRRIYFSNGDVVGCNSNDPADYYGQRLLLHGYLTAEELRRALGRCSREGLRLGTVLRDLGLLSQEDIRKTLHRQISDLVLDLFLWDSGVFFFEAGAVPDEEILPRPVHTTGLVMEGSRWMDEMGRIRKLFPHDHVILRRARIGPEDELSVLERRLVGAVDGRTPLAQIHRELGGVIFHVLEAAYRLCLREILDLTEVGDDPAADPPALEDLLAEQATAEMEAAERGHLQVPVEVLFSHRPVWARPPDEERLEALSPGLRRFCEALDGARPLASALDTDPESRERQVDFLILELSRGRLSLSAP